MEEEQTIKLAAIRRAVTLLDSSIRLPGTELRIGLDGLIGLIPVFGDAATTVFSIGIVYWAASLGAPGGVVLIMLGNVLIDMCTGVFPVIGDLFDFAWKANVKNLALLERALKESPRPPRSPREARRLLAIIVISGFLLAVSCAVMSVLYTIHFLVN